MSPTTGLSRSTAPLQDVDVLIVGASSCGIGAARRLQQRTPGNSCAIVEASTSNDGIRDPFRYPGMYADSEMSTLGHATHPSTRTRSVADGREIPARIPDRAPGSGAEQHIAYGIHVLRACWSGDPAHWVVTFRDCESGALATMSCSFLYLCSSRHRYAEGHIPAWPGLEDFASAVVDRRWKSMQMPTALYRFRPRYPTCARALLRKYGIERPPRGSGLDRRSVQAYEPWDQRIVTPNGLDLHTVGGIELTVDGVPIQVPHRVLYRGMMLDGVPNLAFVLGSGDARWPLTADLVSDHVARLVAHMEERGYTAVTPRLSPQLTETAPVTDRFPGLLDRPDDALPSRGARAPRRLRGRSGKDSAPFCGLGAAQELEFTPADS